MSGLNLDRAGVRFARCSARGSLGLTQTGEHVIYEPRFESHAWIKPLIMCSKRKRELTLCFLADGLLGARYTASQSVLSAKPLKALWAMCAKCCEQKAVPSCTSCARSVYRASLACGSIFVTALCARILEAANAIDLS